MNKYRIELKWAAIFIVMMISWMWLEKLMGFHDRRIDYHPVFTNFILIPIVVIFLLMMKEKRSVFYNGRMTFAQGFISGLVMTVVVTLVTPLIQWMTTTIISPHYFENIIRYSVSSGKMTQPQAEAYFNQNSYLFQATMGSFFMGIIISVIIALIMKKKE